MEFVYEVKASGDFNEVVDKVKESIAKNNFGVLWEMNIKDKLGEKGVNFERNFAIMEVCNPKKAKEVLEKNIMVGYRKNPPKTAGDYKVLKIRDYQNNTITDMTSGEVTDTGLPISDVLYFELNDDAWCAIRPSGTEPKIKFYFGVKGNSLKDADERLDKLMNDEVFKVK